jgi:predicted MFS family arabinose efflux permease
MALPTAPAEERASYREVFAVGQFRVLFTAELLRALAGTAEILGLSVLVYAQTGSALLGALAYGIGFAPQVVGGVLFTAAADRCPPRGLLTVLLGVRALPGAVIGLAPVGLAAMFAIVAVVACLDPVAAAARGGLLPQVLDGDRYVLGRSVLSLTGSFAQIVGLGLGGVLLAVLSARQLLVAAAAVLVAGAVLVRVGLARHPRRTARQVGTVAATWRGNRVLLADRRVRGLLLAQWLPAWLVTGGEALLVPYVAALDRPASAAAGLLVAMPVGMVLGDLLIGRCARPRQRERLAFPLAAGMGLPFVAFVAYPGIPIALLLIVATGFGLGYQLGLQRPFLDTLPAHLHGQGFGLRSTGLMAGQGLGPAAVGALAGPIGVGPAIATAGAACVLGVLTLHHAFPSTHRRTKRFTGSDPGLLISMTSAETGPHGRLDRRALRHPRAAPGPASRTGRAGGRRGRGDHAQR